MASRSLRADAERNRRQLLDTARVVLAERGLDAPLDEIARRAGIGNATLYRHFPTRDQLAAAVFADVLADLREASQRALAEPDTWTGFAGFLTFLGELQARDRALADLLTSADTYVGDLATAHTEIFANVNRLIDNAQRDGHLRPDFNHEDVLLILMANAGILQRAGDQAPTAWRRHLGYLLDSLHTHRRLP
jgi:AcrR family transcriptional regulator